MFPNKKLTSISSAATQAEPSGARRKTHFSGARVHQGLEEPSTSFEPRLKPSLVKMSQGNIQYCRQTPASFAAKQVRLPIDHSVNSKISLKTAVPDRLPKTKSKPSLVQMSQGAIQHSRHLPESFAVKQAHTSIYQPLEPIKSRRTKKPELFIEKEIKPSLVEMSQGRIQYSRQASESFVKEQASIPIYQPSAHNKLPIPKPGYLRLKPAVLPNLKQPEEACAAPASLPSHSALDKPSVESAKVSVNLIESKQLMSNRALTRGGFRSSETFFHQVHRASKNVKSEKEK